MKKILIFLILIILVSGCGKGSIAKDIISNVQDAYDRASVNRIPTLNQVKSYFNMEGASWLADQIISDEGLACDIKIDNNKLVVKCPNDESTKDMPIYK